jgi:hypothetical protein
MITTTDSPATFEELDHREADGISVSLCWSREDGTLVVAVADCRTGEQFELAVAPERALDAFRHPFAYAPANDRGDAAPAAPASVEEAVSELERQTLAFL